MQPSYREYAPCAALREYVQCYWSRQTHADGASAPLNRVLPDGCIDIVFNFGDVGRIHGGNGARETHRGGAVVGTMTTPLLVQPGCRENFFGVRFRPGRARAFFAVPAAEFTDGAVSLGEIWGREGARIEERLAGLASPDARKEPVERELLRRLESANPPDPYVDAVVRLMARHYGVVSIARACEYAGITRQHLARRFEQHVGVPPKMFSRVVRFRSLLARLGSRPGTEGAAISWSDLALDAGYYDQAHLISDFRRFTGLTPEAYRNQQAG